MSKEIDFMIGKPGFKCPIHPDSEYLIIDDDENGVCTSCCLECIYKQLKKLPSFERRKKYQKKKGEKDA